MREYVGGGTLGQLAAQWDAIARDKRLTERECDRLAREETLDGPLAELNELADVPARAALHAGRGNVGTGT